MPKNERAKRKQAEKRDRKREQAKVKAKTNALPNNQTELVKLAAQGDFGPAWMTYALDDDTAEPALATVVVTRKLPRGRWLGHMMLVDRTCLGVKDADLLGPVSIEEIVDRVEDIGREGNPLEPCEAAWAQSIVLHALDYAASLGFTPHRDFVPALVLPRPEPLLDTPLARPARPLYVEGPYDPRDRILRQLAERVGFEGFDYVAEAPEGDEDEDELDDDDEIIIERAENGRRISFPPYHENDPERVARTLVRHYVLGESLELLAREIEDEDAEHTTADELDDWHYEAAAVLEPLLDAMEAEAGGTRRRAEEDELDVDDLFATLLDGCRTHGLEPYAYLRDLLLLHREWPEETLGVLAPAHWQRTLADEPTARALAELRQHSGVADGAEDA